MSISRQIRRMGVATAATLSLFAGSAVVAQASTAEPEQPTAEAVVTLDILSINDFHGRIQADAQSAGAAVLAGAVAKQREANANTLFVSAGDNIGASTFASASQQDNPTIEALGAAGLDLSVVGNHEFDRSFEDLSAGSSTAMPRPLAQMVRTTRWGRTSTARAPPPRRSRNTRFARSTASRWDSSAP